MRERLKRLLGTAAGFGFIGFFLIRMPFRACSRDGCYRTGLGTWLASQSPEFAGFLRLLESAELVLVMGIILIVLLAGARSRFRELVS